MKKYLLIFFSVLFILSACGTSEDEKANSGESEEAVTNENVENDEDSDEGDQGNVNGKVMKLGDTSYVDSGFYQYEITPTSVEMFTERDGITPSNDDEVFVLIDYTIKSMSEEEFEEEDVLIGSGVTLTNAQEQFATEITYYEYDFVDKIPGTIEPNKVYESQFLFEIPVSESSEYRLHFESYPPDVEDSEWSFTEDDAK